MSRDTATAAARNKRIRQEALREQLQAQGHVQHVVDLLVKITDEKEVIDQAMMYRYKVAIDTKLKLIDKYLPTEKPTSIEGDLNVGVTSLASLIAGLGNETGAGETPSMEERSSTVRH
jgi:hypothetical protein